MAERIGSLAEFWPYYLNEHRNPTCRALHFVGTGGFFASVAWGLWTWPVQMLAFGAIAAVTLWVGSERVEAKKPAFLPMGVGVVMLLLGSPWILAGVASAYAAAWIGHFLIEHNRPATFQYPVWSLLCDFRMWGMMATGRLWTGAPAV